MDKYVHITEEELFNDSKLPEPKYYEDNFEEHRRKDDDLKNEQFQYKEYYSRI